MAVSHSGVDRQGRLNTFSRLPADQILHVIVRVEDIKPTYSDQFSTDTYNSITNAWNVKLLVYKLLQMTNYIDC